MIGGADVTWVVGLIVASVLYAVLMKKSVPKTA
jgi:cytosine/uracil/thiamine/allantoin permease